MKHSAKKILLFIILAVAIVGGYSAYRHFTRVEPFTLYGNVDLREAELAFNASERIEDMMVEEGDRVQKGDVLARLNTETLELNIARCQADIRQQTALLDKAMNGSRSEEIAQAEARVSEAQATADNKARTYRRMEQLLANGAVSQQTRDDAAAAYQAAAATLSNVQAARDEAVNGSRTEDISAQQAALDSLQEQLKTYEYQLSQAVLVAPQDGVIRSRLLEVGDMASPTKPVFRLSIDTLKWVRVYVPESRLGEIYEGREAKVKIDSSSQPLTGRVGYISDTAEFTPKSVQTEELRTALVYEVRIVVDDPDHMLRMGMPATVTF